MVNPTAAANTQILQTGRNDTFRLLRPSFQPLRPTKGLVVPKTIQKLWSSACTEPDLEPLILTASKDRLLKAIDRSWIGRYFRSKYTAIHDVQSKKPSVIAADLLFTSSFLRRANNTQVGVALRFIVSRLHVMIQTESMGEVLPWETVENVRERHAGLWQIDTLALRIEHRIKNAIDVQGMAKEKEKEKLKGYIVYGDTGEVITSSDGLGNAPTVFNLRPDWREFMANPRSSRLFSMIKTKDDSTYPQGISKAFRERQAPEKVLEIAERYVMSNVVENR